MTTYPGRPYQERHRFMTRVYFALLACIALLGCEVAATNEGYQQSALSSVTMPASGFGDTGVTSAAAPSSFPAGSVSWCCTTWWTPIDAATGDAIGGVSADVQDNGGAGGNNVIVVLVAQTSTGQQVLGSWSSNGSGSVQHAVVTLATPYVVPSGASLMVKAVALSGGALPGPATKMSSIGPITALPAGHALTSTITLPISQPGTAHPSTISFTGGFSIPMALPIGTHITGLRVMASDSLTGPTRYIVGLRESDSIGNNSVTGSGQASAGNGAMQTVSSAVMDEVVISGIDYSCDTVIVSGTQTVAIHSCEVDTHP